MNQNEITPQDPAGEEIPSIASLPDANDSIAAATQPTTQTEAQYVGEPAVTDTPVTGEPAPVVTKNTLAPVAPVTVTEASYSGSDGKGYEPTFNNTVRTVIYVAGLVATAVGLGFIQFGDPAVGAYVSTVAGLITGGFGVAYNPIRMANK